MSLVAQLYFAHSRGTGGFPEPLRVHLERVAQMAGEFASVFGEQQRATTAGLLHDLGKYGSLFQKVLEGRASHVDHWSAGAWFALKRYERAGVPIALAIQGHHLGLQHGDRDSLRKLAPGTPRPPNEPVLSETDIDILIERFLADGLTLPVRLDCVASSAETVAAMLDVRMLFSALVDADFLCTEAHFDQDRSRLREQSPELNAEALIASLGRFLDSVRAENRGTREICSLREELFQTCTQAAKQPTGIYTLTAPTGSGKTLALLSFALHHARLHGLRRIVAVLPYLNILDQTADVYRKALAADGRNDQSPTLILEDHSLARVGVDSDRLRALLAENWDAPVIITTSVQLLESLFSSSPADCRKLHRLANSVILLDEVQTLPQRLAIPALAALSHLAARYRSTVVFSTATQPAFDHLDANVRRWAASGWKPREIAGAPLNLFGRLKRVSVCWPSPGERTDWETLARQLESLPQALCIVNTKRQARDLFYLVAAARRNGLYHLSTSMCPAHRREVLGRIRARLDGGEPCLLIATQCVEAGVDLDFPHVYRAVAPLDAIAQAAGRCNRNGKLPEGRLTIFRPEQSSWPSADYRQGALITEEMLAARGGSLDLDDPQVFRAYYLRLYAVSALRELRSELENALTALDYVRVRMLFRVIDNRDSINLLVAYNPSEYERLAQTARSEGLSRAWMARASHYSVSVFRPKQDQSIRNYIEPVRLKNGNPAPDWFIHLRPEHYRQDLGLEVPAEMEQLIV